MPGDFRGQVLVLFIDSTHSGCQDRVIHVPDGGILVVPVECYGSDVPEFYYESDSGRQRIPLVQYGCSEGEAPDYPIVARFQSGLYSGHFLPEDLKSGVRYIRFCVGTCSEGIDDVCHASLMDVVKQTIQRHLQGRDSSGIADSQE